MNERNFLERTEKLFGKEVSSKIKTPIFYEKKDLNSGMFQTAILLDLNRLTGKSYDELIALYKDQFNETLSLSEIYDRKRK